MTGLLQPSEMASFGPWEEHLRKHYHEADRAIAFSALAALAGSAQGASIDVVLATTQRSDLSRSSLKNVLIRLHTEGFVTIDSWDNDSPQCGFRNPLLRRWWQRYKPQATL